MIIRRRHTQNFTVIGNALFDDERLQADEVGVMAYLLSRPNDWEIRRSALRRRWNFGAETTKRVINNLIRTGWCRVEKIRLLDGTFRLLYEIRDDAGPELSEEEVRRALSLVSSEVATANSLPTYAPHASDPPEPCGQPPPSQPGVDNQGVATGGVAYKSLTNTDSTRTDSTQALWKNLEKSWPSEHIISRLVCENLFVQLSLQKRQEALQGTGPYLANCRSRERKICDLSTYLRERRWETLNATVQTIPIRGGTPQAFRWIDYRRASGLPTAFMEECFQTGKPWYAPTEWPPAKPLKPSDDDVEALANEMLR